MPQHGKVCHPCPQTCGTSDPDKCRIVVASKQIKALKEGAKPEWIDLPHGYGLFWKDNGVGGRVYYSDEIGGGVIVWDTCLVSEQTLLATIEVERTMVEKEKAFQIQNDIQVKFEAFIKSMKDVPPDFAQALNEKFWDLL